MNYRHTISVRVEKEHTDLCKSLMKRGFELFAIDWDGYPTPIAEFPNEPGDFIYKLIYNKVTTSREPERKIMNIIWSSTADYTTDRKVL